MKKVTQLFLILLSLTMVLAGCGSSSSSSSNASPATKSNTINKDATLNIAYPANPQTLDPHLTTNQSTRDVTREIFEQLLTLDKNYKVVPSLAESYDVSKDDLTYTFHLRKGAKFHNGKEMHADDVVASMDKWLKTSSQGKANLNGGKFTEVDPYTVALHINKPSLIVPYVLADTAPFPAIVPKESVVAAGSGGLKEYIGTGPFKLAEWKVGQFVHLTRFDGYSSRTEESSGLAGKKAALVKDIFFRIVPDSSVRVSGVLTGQYDMAFDIPFDSVDQIEGAKDVQAAYSDGGIAAYVFNKKEGPFSNVKLRQAFSTALDAKKALLATYSNEKFFKIDPALALPNQTDWYSTAGKENYNQHNLDKAKQLVKESGYSGQELKILTTKDYPEQFNLAVVAQQVLQSIGVKSKLDVYDWPTLQERRTNPKNFDVFPMTFAVRPTLHQDPFLATKAKYAGWTNDPKIDQLLNQIKSAKSFAAAKPSIDALQAEVWQYLPVLKVGDIQSLVAVNKKVTGYQDLIGPILWNVGKSE